MSASSPLPGSRVLPLRGLYAITPESADAGSLSSQWKRRSWGCRWLQYRDKRSAPPDAGGGPRRFFPCAARTAPP
ncbi:MAG: hypothetical protein IPJ99_01480 [Betaproteobacteria bacterium]|nr:hypothetical protein [Betaproteobacteria bacterium]